LVRHLLDWFNPWSVKASQAQLQMGQGMRMVLSAEPEILNERPNLKQTSDIIVKSQREAKK